MSVKIFTNDIEKMAKKQVMDLANTPAFSKYKIRIMPDVHAGAGCVIGFTASLGKKVIPNIVGVDIGCGMLVEKLSLPLDDIDLSLLDDTIRKNIPTGFRINSEDGIFPKIKKLKCLSQLKNSNRFLKSLGTLGGGNHFIELDKGTNSDIYLVVHTGSRNLGKQVCDYYQKLAESKLSLNSKKIEQRKKKIIKENTKKGTKERIQKELECLKNELKKNYADTPKEFAFLTGKDRQDYLHDMKICQEFAQINRDLICSCIINNYNKIAVNKLDVISKFETVHNYISFKDNIIRKGAVSARKSEKIIIPINMRDGSLIAIGKGNKDWNRSAPHGAGRLMSRKQAKETVSIKEYKDAMKGIFSTTVNVNTIDEAPQAYKPIDEIIKNIEPTAHIIEVIKPVFNFKDDTSGKN